MQPTADNIIAEKSKVIARLHNEIAFGYTTIEAKQRVSNDEFLSLEPSIWKEFGEVLQELMQKMEKEINCHDLYISLQVGKENKLMNEKEKRRKFFWNRSIRKRVKRG